MTSEAIRVAIAEAMRCPFCNHLRLTVDMNQSVYWVHCIECGADGPHSLHRDRAILLWNHGVDNPSAMVAKRDSNQRMSKAIE